MGTLRNILRAGPAAVAAVLAGGLVTATAGAPAAHAAGGSVLTKTVQDVTHPGANPINHGDTLAWVLSYADNASSVAPATITDSFAGAPSQQAYVPGSLHVPPGWTASWSTNGTSFGSTDTGTATTAVRASNPAAQPAGTAVAAPLSPPQGLTSGASVSLTPGAFYCSGGSGLVQGYSKVSLQSINVADVDLAASTVTVTDPGGGVIATPPLASDGTADLSGISATAHPSITVTASLVLNNANDFGGGNQPALVASFAGLAPQVCFRTTVSPTNCAATGVLNVASGADATGTFTSNAASLLVAPGPSCQPQVTVNKQICASTRASDCGPGGSGPWVKQSSPGLLGLLGTAFWRITVTNAGPVDATQVSVNDFNVMACQTAGGTFTLAANTSKQVFCSTTLLVLPFTNTASASFIAAQSPAGTQPTTTGSSSATACSLLCILTTQQSTH